MRIVSDDDLHRHSPVWLGPEGITWLVAARYKSWGLWVILFSMALTAMWLLPWVPFTAPLAFYALLGTIVLTYAIMAKVDPDQPVRAVITTFWYDLTARTKGDDVPTRYKVTRDGWRIKISTEPAMFTPTPRDVKVYRTEPTE